MCPKAGDVIGYTKVNQSKIFFLVFQRFDRRRICLLCRDPSSVCQLNLSFKFPTVP